MMNQLFISEYNSKVEYGDKFQVVVFAHSISCRQVRYNKKQNGMQIVFKNA